MSTPEQRPLDRSTADQIIQRALQLDAERAESLTEAQLRDIASELSLSPAALDQALAEHRARASDANLVVTQRPRLPWYAHAGTAISVILVVIIVMSMVFRL
jgi:predicted component of type VI protein secretion system